MKAKKIIKNIISIVMVVIFATNVFAESNVIYAPTAAPNVVEENISVETNEIVSPVDEVITFFTEDVQSIEYEKVYNIYEADNGNYYCNSNGDVVKNAWRKISRDSFSNFAPIENFTHDYIWAYFNSAGRATKAASGKIKKVAIGDSQYAFNEYGQMLEGFFNDEGQMWDGTGDPFDLISDNNYLYHADTESGKLTKGWFKYIEGSDKYENKNDIWLYFLPSTYRSVRSTGNNYKSQNIDGKTYAFDNNGVMLTGFEAMRYNEENGGNTSKIVYFSMTGEEVKNDFVEVNLDDELNNEIYEDTDEDITIYLNKSGTMYKDAIKKIGSSYYGFDSKGVLVKGLSVWNGSKYIATIETPDTDGKDFIINGVYKDKEGSSHTLSNGETIHYFSSSGKRTLSGKLEFADENYTYKATNSGGINGLSDKKYYKNGLLMKAISDSKYGIYIVNPTSSSYSFKNVAGNPQAYVVNTQGTKQTSTSGIKDSEENHWLLSNTGHLINIYSVQVKFSNGNYYYRSENRDGNTTWILFGEKDIYGKTCVKEVKANGTAVAGGAISSYQIVPSSEVGLNFYLN